MSLWLQQLFGTSPWEVAAVVLALAYLLLAVRRSLWCWACALVSTAIYFVIFARTGLYMQAVLQVFYFGMALYGWHEWSQGRTESGDMRIASWPVRAHLAGIIAVLVLAAINGWLLVHYSDAQAPYLDSLVTWASVLTTWMVARRVIENWLYWIVVDALAAWLYFAQGLTATAGLFLVYIAIVIHGWWVWRRALAQQQAET